MCTFKRKFRKLSEKNDPIGKQRVWNRLVKELIGCRCCQYFNKKKNRCKKGHQNILQERNGLPCDDISPTVV